MGEWVIKVYVEPLQLSELSGEERRSLYVFDAFPQEKLEAAGCPRLAFLLGMREAADPLEEEIARWRLWLIPPDAVQRGMRLKKRGLPKIRRGGYASLEELMRLIDSIFLLKSVALFVHTHRLWPLQEYETDEEEENEREREAYRRYLEARRAIIAEIERLGKLVEAGPRSPEMDRALERYIEDVYSRVTVEFPVESEEAARALAKRGAEVWKSGGAFTVRARRPDHLPEEFREREREEVYRALKELAAMLTLIHSKRLEGFVCARLV
jgi:uncharacterized protein YciI